MPNGDLTTINNGAPNSDGNSFVRLFDTVTQKSTPHHVHILYRDEADPPSTTCATPVGNSTATTALVEIELNRDGHIERVVPLLPSDHKDIEIESVTTELNKSMNAKNIVIMGKFVNQSQPQTTATGGDECKPLSDLMDDLYERNSHIKSLLMQLESTFLGNDQYYGYNAPSIKNTTATATATSAQQLLSTHNIIAPTAIRPNSANNTAVTQHDTAPNPTIPSGKSDSPSSPKNGFNLNLPARPLSPWKEDLQQNGKLASSANTTNTNGHIVMNVPTRMSTPPFKQPLQIPMRSNLSKLLSPISTTPTFSLPLNMVPTFNTSMREDYYNAVGNDFYAYAQANSFEVHR